MKKILAVFVALMALCFTQCKPAPEGDEENNGNNDTRMVKVRCEIPINNGTRSDFTNLIEEGRINWSEGRECVYLAIHGDNPQLIELESWADGNPSVLEFTGEAAEGLIASGEEYDVWYFGHSQQLDEPYVNLDEGLTEEQIIYLMNKGYITQVVTPSKLAGLTIQELKNKGYITGFCNEKFPNKIEGSISNQSGRLEDLGYCHIAMTSVEAVVENGDVRLNLSGVLKTQIAIALLDLEKVTELYGDAIVGTEYVLEYNDETGRYEFDVIEDADARISVESASGISYVVLLPNDNKETIINGANNSKVGEYTFQNYIKANKVYCRVATDGKTVEALPWSWMEETNKINGHEYVDLGLPSGLLWATCNVGANAPEEYGDYFAWGETTTKSDYSSSNCPTYGLSESELQSQGYIDSEGNLTSQYDAATANWGGNWRMPTYDEVKELRNRCTWTWTTQNGVNGYKVTGPSGASIFLPAAGFRDGSSLYSAGSRGYYCSSTPCENFDNDSRAYGLYFNSDGHSMDTYFRYHGRSVRSVFGGGFEGPAAQYAVVTTSEVTDITSNSAVCGGNVTTDNGSEVIARGICWSTSQNPTIEDSKTTDGSGVGSFTSNLSNLVSQTTYYVRAYATNEVGTSYGEEMSFTTLKPTTGASNGHDWVDLGLPSGLKWATCNVGASSPEKYGNYYAWGGTTTKSSYSENNCNCSSTPIWQLKSSGYIDSKGNLTSQNDAATANWGGDWRMPTKSEMQELIDKCTWTWTTQNGVKGYKVTGPNGNNIFLPATGYRYDLTLSSVGSVGNYWSSTAHEYITAMSSYICYGFDLNFNSGQHNMDYSLRYYGQSVRPVLE